MRTANKQKSRLVLVALSPEDMRKLPKAHKGFDAYASTLVTLFRSNAQALSTDGLDLDGLLGDVRAYQALAQPEVDAQKQLAMVQATRLLHASDAWHVMLEMYARAVAAGRTNATVRAGIAEFVAYLKRTSKKKKPVAPAPPVTA